MRSKKGIRRLVVQGIISSFIIKGGIALGDAPAPKWYDTIGLSGYLVGSYVNNLTSPATKVNTNRLFDQESNSFNLNAFHLQVAKPVGDDGVGFTAKLHTGRDARVIKSANGGNALTGAASTPGANDFDLEEAYLTYVP